MANNWQRGDLVPIIVQPLGGAVTRLNIKKHSLNLSILLVDTTHTGTGGYTGRLGQKADAKGSITAGFDLDAPPYAAAPSMIPGTSGIALFYVSVAALNKYIQVPIIVGELRFETGVEQEVVYGLDVAMNIHAGTFAFPAA